MTRQKRQGGREQGAGEREEADTNILPLAPCPLPPASSGAVGIFLKALWDSTFTNTVGDVILDVQDVQDVQGYLG